MKRKFNPQQQRVPLGQSSSAYCPFLPSSGTVEIPLTQGKTAIVDASDYSLVQGLRWFAKKDYRTFYAVRNIRNATGRQKSLFMHRFLLGAATGVLVDHKNGNGLDNRRDNLRIATPSENVCNSAYSNKTGYRGVYARRSKRNPFCASITVSGKTIHLGAYKTGIEAAKAYDMAALKAYGEFARTNFQGAMA